LTSILDELFESFKISFHPTRNYPERVTSFFDETFRLIGQLKADLRAIGTGRRKINDAGNIFASIALPCDQLVGNLFGDSRIPFLVVACYLGFLTQPLII